MKYAFGQTASKVTALAQIEPGVTSIGGDEVPFEFIKPGKSTVARNRPIAFAMVYSSAEINNRSIFFS